MRRALDLFGGVVAYLDTEMMCICRDKSRIEVGSGRGAGGLRKPRRLSRSCADFCLVSG